MQSTGARSTSSVPGRSLLPLSCAEHAVSRRHFFPGVRCAANTTSLVIHCAIHAYASGQTSESTCLPCSSSQSCPPGSSVPTQITQGVTTFQIAAYVCSALASVVGVFVAIFKVYPFIKARIAKLREIGIKPTLKRVIFLQKTLLKYQPLLAPVDRQAGDIAGSSANNSMGIYPQDFIASVPRPSARIVNDTVPVLLHAPPALLLLTAVQLGNAVHKLPAALKLPVTCPRISRSCRSPLSAQPMLATASSSLTTASPVNISPVKQTVIWLPLSQTSAYPRSSTRLACLT